MAVVVVVVEVVEVEVCRADCSNGFCMAVPVKITDPQKLHGVTSRELSETIMTELEEGEKEKEKEAQRSAH